jgi:hypothetical protein
MFIVLKVDHVTFADRVHSAGDVIEVDETFGRRLIERDDADEAHPDLLTEPDSKPKNEPGSDPVPEPEPEPNRRNRRR